MGDFTIFGLGDGSGTPSLGINLADKLDLRKPLENINRLTLRLSFSLTLKGNQEEKHTENQRGHKLEF